MKKYIKPEIQPVEVENKLLIAVSNLNDTYTSAEALSNEDHGWGDDDDEDGWKWPSH